MSESFFPCKLNQPRSSDEDFKTYQLRRWNENTVIRMYLKGQLIWNSNQRGTRTKESVQNTFELNIV